MLKKLILLLGTQSTESILHIEDWVSLALDPEAERLMPEKRKEIDQGKGGLRQIKTLILEMIRKI
jgi:hypothetical protein